MHWSFLQPGFDFEDRACGRRAWVGICDEEGNAGMCLAHCSSHYGCVHGCEAACLCDSSLSLSGCPLSAPRWLMHYEHCRSNGGVEKGVCHMLGWLCLASIKKSSETRRHRKYCRQKVCHSGAPKSHCLRLGNMPLGSTVTAPYIVMYRCKCLNALASKLAELCCNAIPYKL